MRIGHDYAGYVVVGVTGLVAVLSIFATSLVLRKPVKMPVYDLRALLLWDLLVSGVSVFWLGAWILDGPGFSVVRFGDGHVDLRGDLLPIGRIPTRDILQISLVRHGKDGPHRSLRLVTRGGRRYQSWPTKNCRELLALAQQLSLVTERNTQHFITEGHDEKSDFHPAALVDVCGG